MIRQRNTTLYHFENNDIVVLEIKRNLLSETDKTKLYFWLLYDKKNDCLDKLEFVSSSENGGKEQRTFEGGYSIEFDKQTAIFNNSGQIYQLKVMPTDKPLPDALGETIADYIISLSFRR